MSTRNFKGSVDWRFQQANREALWAVMLTGIYFLWWYGFAYGLGDRPIEEYGYVMGMPSWFFYSCVVGFVVFSLFAGLMVNCLFRTISLDEHVEENGDE